MVFGKTAENSAMLVLCVCVSVVCLLFCFLDFFVRLGKIGVLD